jgi:hypothetical protein
MQLGDMAKLVRSKNAGPYMLTIDVMFAEATTFDRVARSGVLAAPRVAQIYGADPAAILTFELREALTIKISFPRDVPSGSIGDSDVYGCQYMWRLATTEVDLGADT